MKCDELKAMTAVDAYEEYENNILDESKHHYYNKQEVDAAIDELKADLKEKENLERIKQGKNNEEKH